MYETRSLCLETAISQVSTLIKAFISMDFMVLVLSIIDDKY